MNISFLLKDGMLEYTAKVLVETALPKATVSEPSDSDYVFIFNRSLMNAEAKGKKVFVFKELNDSHFLIDVIEALKRLFPEKTNSQSFGNLEWFAKEYSEIDSSDLISDVVLNYRALGIDVLNLSKEELITMLKKNVKFTRQVDEMLGVKLHLYANHNKLSSYYKWLEYKFSNLYMHHKSKCGYSFFTVSEVDSFYRSLASKIRYVNRIIDDTLVDVIERDNSSLGCQEKIYLLSVPSINRALNEVILKGEDEDNLIVCCKSNNVALYSFWKNDNIVHNIISGKSKVDRVVEYIEPLTR